MGLAIGTNAPAVHVGFPQLLLQDSLLGIRFADSITAFPAGMTVGATWNHQLMDAARPRPWPRPRGAQRAVRALRRPAKPHVR